MTAVAKGYTCVDHKGNPIRFRASNDEEGKLLQKIFGPDAAREEYFLVPLSALTGVEEGDSPEYVVMHISALCTLQNNNNTNSNNATRMEQIADSVVARGIRLEENGSGDTISVDAPESPSPTGTVVNRQPIFRIPSTPPALLAPSKVTPQRENNNNINSGQPVNNDFSYETEWSYPDFYSF